MLEILKAAVTTGSGSFVSLLLGAIALKVMAVIAGPNGVGLFSLLRQTQQTATVIGSFGGQTALIQAIASREPEQKIDYLAKVAIFFAIGGTAVALCLAVTARWLGPWILGSKTTSAVLLTRWMAVPVIVGIAVVFLSGLLNGFQRIAALAWTQVAAAFVIAILAYPASRFFINGHPTGFVAALALSLGGSVLVSIIAVRQLGVTRQVQERFRISIDSEPARHFLRMAGTQMVTGLITTGSVLAIRALVANKEGLRGAGIFDVAWTFSMMYVMLILTSFSTYYLPALSQIKDRDLRVDLMRRVMRFAVLVMVPLVVVAIVLRPFIVHLLYSREFSPALHTMRWMLIGDYFKVVSWVLSISMLAFVDMKNFFLSECLGNIFLVASSAIAIFKWKSIEGIGLAFVVLYVVYLGYMMIYAYRRHGFTLDARIAVTFSAGAVLMLAASYAYWNVDEVIWMRSAAWIFVAGAFSWLALRRSERHSLLVFAKDRIRF